MKPAMIQQITTWMKRHRDAILSGAGIVLLFGILFGIGAGTGKETDSDVKTEEILAAEETKASRPELPFLEEDQRAILDGVIRSLEENNIQEAARQLLENQQKLQYVFYQVMEGEQYLYQDGRLSEELEGTGLVMRKPMSVFFGEFHNGLPEGEGIILQGIYLDGMRYDYSKGTWSRGMMNGEGESGYHYYKGIRGEENQALQKKGTFVNDLMEGSFSYRTTNSEGVTTIWDMEAEEGRTKLDDRWVYEEEKQGYVLSSNENESHKYVLPGNAEKEVRWRNLLTWKE